MKKLKSLEQLGIAGGANVLIFTPHPDDETAFSAGLIQRIKKLGGKVYLVCFSRGDASTLKYGLAKNQNLGDVRERELKKAGRILGVDGINIIDLGDGKLTKNHTKLKKYIIEEIIKFDPSLVVVFEPWGVYGHPDHVALSKAVTEVYKSDREKFRLLYTTIDDRYIINPGAKAMADDPDRVKPISANLILKLNPIEIWKKFQAFQAHKTQFAGNEMNTTLKGKWKNRFFLLQELFYLVPLNSP